MNGHKRGRLAIRPARDEIGRLYRKLEPIEQKLERDYGVD